MAANGLTERYSANLHGVLSCYDRLIVTGTLPGACYAGGMTSFLYAKGIRIFDYPRFAEPLRDRIRERAHEVCAAAGVQIEHVNKSHIRKEDLVSRVLAVRGDAPGLVHVLSAMESCPSYKPWPSRSSARASTSCRKTTPSCAWPTQPCAGAGRQLQPRATAPAPDALRALAVPRSRRV